MHGGVPLIFAQNPNEAEMGFFIYRPTREKNEVPDLVKNNPEAQKWLATIENHKKDHDPLRLEQDEARFRTKIIKALDEINNQGRIKRLLLRKTQKELEDLVANIRQPSVHTPTEDMLDLVQKARGYIYEQVFKDEAIQETIIETCLQKQKIIEEQAREALVENEQLLNDTLLKAGLIPPPPRSVSPYRK